MSLVFKEVCEIAHKEGINSVHQVLINEGNITAILKRVKIFDFKVHSELELETLRYDSTQQALREVVALRKISCSSFSAKILFPTLYNTLLDDSGTVQCIIEEKASEGTLEQFLSSRFENGPVDEFDCLEKSTLPQKMQLSFSIRMLLAVHAMKTVLNICHNDIFGNIMVTKCTNAHETYSLRPGCNVCVPTYGYRPLLVDFGQYCPFSSNPLDVYDIGCSGTPLFFDDFTSMMYVIQGCDIPRVRYSRIEASVVEQEILKRAKQLYTKELFWYLFGAK